MRTRKPRPEALGLLALIAIVAAITLVFEILP